MKAPTPPSLFWLLVNPRYLPTWLGLGLMCIIALFPFRLQLQLGVVIGLCSFYLAGERRRVCEINIALCLPELSAKEQSALVRNTFVSMGIGVVEIGLSWCRNPQRFRDRVTVSGLEYLQQADDKGKGTLLLCAHFSTLEFAGTLLSLFHPMDVTYARQKNLVLERVMTGSRRRHFGAVIERKDVRQALKRLKSGHTLWYAPDQDYGARHSVYAKFFGVTAATVRATSKIARFNDSAVIFFSHYRRADNSGYHLEFTPVTDAYPTGEDITDAQLINDVIETAIRKHPEQYLWLHKRFKTQQTGKASSPYQKNPR